MNSLANRIAVAIKNANAEETASIEVMQYALNIILNTLIIIIGTAAVGGLTGHLQESLTFLLFCCLLRLASGGVHLKSAAACNIVTILLSTLVPLLSELSEPYLWLINPFSLLIMILFSPNPDVNAQISRKLFPLLKAVSVLLVLSNFAIHSAVIGLAFLVQSLTVIYPSRRTTP
ncbi:accessory gene regulator B family protein [Paenibacillus tengchongensis]|uniref:accessory gene regulator B family protein n=1 Tax=Paenibacillus tengchongensis TaxID=2608684 RepID=UPI00124D02BD|nr:accessory gene regulator B family protein [Paenibacillus tengchongensis]